MANIFQIRYVRDQYLRDSDAPGPPIHRNRTFIAQWRWCLLRAATSNNFFSKLRQCSIRKAHVLVRVSSREGHCVCTTRHHHLLAVR